MDKLISVILPVYNGESYLQDAIESILNQTYQNFELIIINDGSTDKSNQIIERYLKFKKIKYISRVNKGLIFSLNEAIKISKGEYIARMDQDDICYPQRLEKQINFMEKKNIDICGSDYEIINSKGQIINKKDSHKSNFELILSAMMVPFIHPSVMFKNFFQSNNTFYGSDRKIMAEDYDLWIKLIKMNFKFGNINEILIQYRKTESSMSRINEAEIFCEVYKSCEKFNKEFRDEISSILFNKNLKNINNIIYLKSLFNFSKVNGMNLKIVSIVFNFKLIYLFPALMLFLRQEFNYLKNKLKLSYAN
jgi:glycosyltransferase involved in cell wall biosynthesis